MLIIVDGEEDDEIQELMRVSLKNVSKQEVFIVGQILLSMPPCNVIFQASWVGKTLSASAAGVWLQF